LYSPSEIKLETPAVGNHSSLWPVAGHGLQRNQCVRQRLAGHVLPARPGTSPAWRQPPRNSSSRFRDCSSVGSISLNPMRFPLALSAKIAGHIIKHKLRKTPKFAMVLQLEPLHTCNLTCTGCGRIREYSTSLKDMVPLEKCLQ